MKKQIATLSLLTLALGAYAQDPNAVTIPDVTGQPLPASTFEFWTYAIAVIVPLLVGGMKKLVPKIPTWVLPVSTPFLGIVLGSILKWVGAANLSWVDMAQAGGLAVLIRESWNQIVTKNALGQTGAKVVGMLMTIGLLAGCQSPAVTKSIVTTTVATGVAFGVEKNPSAVHYLRAAAPVVCAAAASTNISPAQVVQALQLSPAEQFKTPEAIIIMNGCLSLYITLFEQYAADYVKNTPLLQSYLQGTCDGIQMGLPASGLARPAVSSKPHVK